MFLLFLVVVVVVCGFIYKTSLSIKTYRANRASYTVLLGVFYFQPEMSYPVSEYGWEYMAFHGFNPDDYRMKAILVGVGPSR